MLNDYVRARVAPGQVTVDEATVLRFVETMLPNNGAAALLHLAPPRRRPHRSSDGGHPEELTSNTLVVGFVDVVGYTGLTRQLTEAQLGQLRGSVRDDRH